jgi:5-carboxymethyl-2-hydroxymuconate isomerase
MPTIHFEYTNNLKISEKIKPFLLEVHHLFVEMIKTDLPTCRSLVTPYADYVVGNGDSNNAFIQLTIKILPGRSDELKKQTGKALFDKIKATFSDEINRLNTEVRVYLQETDVEHYHGLNG